MNQIDPLPLDEFGETAAVAKDHQRILAIGGDRHMLCLESRQCGNAGSSRRSNDRPSAGGGDRRGDIDGAPLNSSLFAKSGQNLEKRERHGKVACVRRDALCRARRRHTGSDSLVFHHLMESIMTDTPMPLAPSTQRLQRDAGATIAYHRTSGKSPGIVFLTGYKSDMSGQKAVWLEEFCRARGNAYVRFDYYGHGLSSGAFTDGTIGRWAEDTLAVLDHLTEGPQILVGSSLGGWIMILAALQRSDRIAGLVGTAAAPDFTEDILIMLNDDQRTALERDGVIPVYSPYDPEPTPVTRRIIEEARQHLVMREEIPLDCPVRLIHGMEDPDVPWQISWQLAAHFRSRDVEITLIKAGDHRLSEPHDLDRLC